MENRLDWIDLAKFVGIIIVIYAHVPKALGVGLIFMFHMPFFFMISGYLYKKRPFFEEIKRSGLALLIPYLVYNALLIIFTPPGSMEISFNTVLNVFVGNQEKLPWHFSAMWFVFSLFLMRIISSAIGRGLYVASIIIFFMGIFLLPRNVFNEECDYLQLKTTMLCYQFFAFGYTLRNYEKIDIIKNMHKANAIVICVIGVFLLFVIGWNCGVIVNLFRGQMGNSILAFLLVSYGLSYFLFKLFELSHLRSNGIIRKISTGTLFIVCTHQSLILIINRYISFDRVVTPFLTTTLILVVSYYLIALIDEHFPLLLGKRKLMISSKY